MNTQDKHLTPFIPSALDDYGLSPAQFRVFCAIARRGECFGAVPNLARHCGMHRDTAWAALKFLESRNIIRREARKGRTNLFSVNPLGQWLPSGKEGSAESKGHRQPKIRADHPAEKKGCKGTPTKVLPLSYSPAQGIDPAGRTSYHESHPRTLSYSPTQVGDPLFISTWEKWMEYRRGLRNRPKNIEGMFAEQLAWLAGYPNAVAIEIIQQSLRNGWQGLFPPRGSGVGLAVARPSRRSGEETYADHGKGF